MKTEILKKIVWITGANGFVGKNLLSLFPKEKSKVALLNIGSEELKGNEIIRETYQKINQIILFIRYPMM